MCVYISMIWILFFMSAQIWLWPAAAFKLIIEMKYFSKMYSLVLCKGFVFHRNICLVQLKCSISVSQKMSRHKTQGDAASAKSLHRGRCFHMCCLSSSAEAQRKRKDWRQETQWWAKGIYTPQTSGLEDCFSRVENWSISLQQKAVPLLKARSALQGCRCNHFCSDGGDLVRISGLLNAKKHRQILIHHVVPSGKCLFSCKFILQHDNETKQKARVIKDDLQ